MKSKLVFLIAMVICIAVFFVLFNAFKGYYPIPVGVKQIYYSFKYRNQDLPYFVIDDKFDLSKIGNTANVKFSDNLNLQHIISIEFNKKIRLPPNYHFGTSIKINIFRDNKLIYEIVKKDLKHFSSPGDDGEMYTEGLYLARLPFPIGTGTYKNLTIKLSVLAPDVVLKSPNNNVKIIIYPNIGFDAQSPD